MNRGSKLDQAKSPNVIGMLEGSDPKLKKEFIVYSAHLDHIGITEPVQGDSINNGAYDNAVGIAFLIELARTFGSLKERPRRSILFAAVTAEEKGLQGSDYLAQHPPLNGSIVANLNTDMVLMLFPFTDVIIFGEEHSTLGAVARKAVEDSGLTVTPDPAPDEVFFVRSDQYSFVKQGIPSVNLDSGYKSEDPEVDGEKIVRQWLKTTYHSPQDQRTQKMEWTSGIKLIRANFLAGLRTANADQPPSWNPGDFFGTTYGK
jgi:Zn-dependent M28 family amino/carboxypeptidase